MKFILQTFLLLTAFASTAKVVNQTQLLTAEQQVNKQELNLPIKDMNVLIQQLDSLPSVEESILAKSRLLILLSQAEPTNDQKEWVIEQEHSKENLQVSNPDHPEQLIEIINIARQAENTQFQWLVTQKVKNITTQWLAQNWQWQPFLEAPTKLDYNALAKAISKTDELTLEWLQQQLIEHTLSNASNRLLAILVKNKNNAVLFSQLWKNPSDQYSFQILQQLNTLLPTDQAIEQLILASENDKLLSQSLLLLAKDFQHRDKAQQFLLEKLQKSRSAWYAAAALSQTNNSLLQKEVIALAQHSNKAAIKYAVQHILENKEIKE